MRRVRNTVRRRLKYPDQIPPLIALIKPGSRPEVNGPGSAIGRVSDEDRLLAAAGFHRMSGYVAQAAQDGRLVLSPDARRRAAGKRLDDTVRGGMLRGEAAAVAPILEEVCGRPPVLIKGASVADRLYPDPRLRPFQDLDFVVPAERLADAAHALSRELGYRRLPEPWAGYGERQGHHVALGRQAGATAMLVELHWRISSDPVARHLDHRYLAASSRSLSLAGASVAVAGTSAQLLVLACHLLHEESKRLVWLRDLDLAARAASRAEWESAFGAADELGLSWVLHRALDYPQRVLGLDRVRPTAAGKPPRWGPFRANEVFGGWLAMQAGQLALGGWTEEDGYLRSALRARRRALRRSVTLL